MTTDLPQLWVYLAGSPLLWLTVTLVAYQCGVWLFQRLGCHPLVNPVLTAIVLLCTILKASDTTYATYFRGAQFVHFLLGPATVALAIPLYREVAVIRKTFVPIAVSLVVGSVTAIVTAVGIAWACGSDRLLLLSLSPKSITTPIAMGVSEKIGGLPALTAVTVVLTGITGVVIGDAVLNALKVHDEKARGMALGVASHGIGTAHAMQKSRTSGAFAAIAMALNGLFTALLLPAIISLLW